MEKQVKLWVDDLRPAPPGWTWALTSEQALALLEEHTPRDDIDEISLDHDLSGEDTTRTLVRWMAANDVWPAVLRVHTANGVGREWLEGMINRYGPGVTR
jgi:hypothetical protein